MWLRATCSTRSTWSKERITSSASASNVPRPFPLSWSYDDATEEDIWRRGGTKVIRWLAESCCGGANVTLIRDSEQRASASCAVERIFTAASLSQNSEMVRGIVHGVESSPLISTLQEWLMNQVLAKQRTRLHGARAELRSAHKPLEPPTTFTAESPRKMLRATSLGTLDASTQNASGKIHSQGGNGW